MSEMNFDPLPTHSHQSDPPALAGFWRRAAATIIDLFILYYPLAFVFCLPTLVLILLSESQVITPNSDHLIIVMALGIPLFFVAWWLLSALSESGKHQGSLGKRFLGLRVVRLDGQPVTFGHASVRFLGKLISIGLLLVGYLIQPFTVRKQTLHDLLVGTLVVHRVPPDHHPAS